VVRDRYILNHIQPVWAGTVSDILINEIVWNIWKLIDFLSACHFPEYFLIHEASHQRSSEGNSVWVTLFSFLLNKSDDNVETAHEIGKDISLVFPWNQSESACIDMNNFLVWAICSECLVSNLMEARFLYRRHRTITLLNCGSNQQFFECIHQTLAVKIRASFLNKPNIPLNVEWFMDVIKIFLSSVAWNGSPISSYGIYIYIYLNTLLSWKYSNIILNDHQFLCIYYILL
jgi:hypothetical protein